jgi:hypothetical protein
MPQVRKQRLIKPQTIGFCIRALEEINQVLTDVGYRVPWRARLLEVYHSWLAHEIRCQLLLIAGRFLWIIWQARVARLGQ